MNAHNHNLNPMLLNSQKRDNIDEITINALHDMRVALFHQVELMIYQNGIHACRENGLVQSWIDRLRNIEFALQRAWGFEEDESKHSWWYRIPYCICPEKHAEEAYKTGVPIRVTNVKCPIHGITEVYDEGMLRNK